MTHQETQPKAPIRLRRLALVGGSLAVLAVVGSAYANQAVADDDRSAARPTILASDPPQRAGAGHDAAPGTQRDGRDGVSSGMEALEAAMARVAPDGVVSDQEPVGMNYEPNRDGSPNALGSADLALSGGASAGGVTVTYSPVKAGDDERYSQCHALLTDCKVFTLDDGSTVLTYSLERSLVPWNQGPAEAVAAHRVVNGNVVSLLASSPYDVEAGASLGDDAVLTRDQLVDVISQPEWSELKPLD